LTSYSRRSPTVREFAESKEFCGKVLYPRQRLLLKLFFLEDLTPEEDAVLDYWISGGYNQNEVVISPFVRERVAWLKENGYKHFREIVLVGGRRCSKGFVSPAWRWPSWSMTRSSFRTRVATTVSTLSKEIYFSCHCHLPGAGQAAVQYADFSSMVNSCQAIQRNIFKAQELEFSLMTETDIRQARHGSVQGRKSSSSGHLEDPRQCPPG
jgi:hypothetical protein